MHVNFFGYSLINNFHNDKSISSVNLYMCITYSEIAFHMFKIWAILKDYKSKYCCFVVMVNELLYIFLI